MSKYGVFSAPYFPVFKPNTEIYGLEKIPYLDSFHTVIILIMAGYNVIFDLQVFTLNIFHTFF